MFLRAHDAAGLMMTECLCRRHCTAWQLTFCLVLRRTYWAHALSFGIPLVTEMQLQFTGLEHLVWHLVVD